MERVAIRETCEKMKGIEGRRWREGERPSLTTAADRSTTLIHISKHDFPA